MNFSNRFVQKIYRYLFINDDQTILIKDICKATNISKPTVIKYIKWLELREIIRKDGKHFKILQS